MQTNERSLAYRPDIDGLRAVAVLSAVTYHAFPNVLKGGFTSVEIFFVISGYLIGGIILRDLRRGVFTFSGFYGRRIRRIFPALIVVLASTLAFGWFALYPDEYRTLGKHVAGGAAFIANCIFWGEVGYFDVAGNTKPLLHLWTLGIEEQFYIVFPLLLWCCAKRRLSALGALSALALLSFLGNFAIHESHRAADFYSPQTRVWELLCGAALAARQLRTPPSQREKRGSAGETALALCGCAFVLASYAFVRESDPYPGGLALLPVCGTLCLIAAGPANPVNRLLLSNRPAVFIGQVSYPFYLWHWVLLSYAWIINTGLDESTVPLRATLVCSAFALAVLTWRFVEKPFRFGARCKREKTLVLTVALTLVGGAGALVFARNGFPSRFHVPEYIDRIRNEENAAVERCAENLSAWGTGKDDRCKFSRDAGKNTVALVGDSHADHLFAGMIADAQRDPGTILFMGGCAAPYLDIMSATDIYPLAERKTVSGLINSGFNYIAGDSAVQTVVLAHQPSCSFINGMRDLHHPELTDRTVIMENGMRRTFDFLRKHHKKVIVLLTNPTLPFEPQKCLKRPFASDRSNDMCRFDRRSLGLNISLYWWYKSIIFKIIADYPDVKILDLTNLFCDEQYCRLTNDHKLLYKDTSHLTIDGSIYVSDAILKALEK